MWPSTCGRHKWMAPNVNYVHHRTTQKFVSMCPIGYRDKRSHSTTEHEGREMGRNERKVEGRGENVWGMGRGRGGMWRKAREQVSSEVARSPRLANIYNY